MQTSRALTASLLALCCGSLLWCSAAPRAFAQAGLEPVTGFGWDLTLDGGVGFGIAHQLDNNFLGRARIGALYFSEPLVYALGITGEVGGLADYGAGLAFEVSHFDGLWARVGGSRVHGGDWMTQVTAGYLFFGLEWQHRFESSVAVSDALMFVFRVPVGVWWFLMRDQHPPQSPVVPLGPEPTPESRAQSIPSVHPGDRLLAARLIEEANLAEQQQHWPEAETLLSRAAVLDPSPLLTLRLARVQRKASHVVSAADNLRRFVDAAVTPDEIDARPDAERERLEVLSMLGYLRLRVEPLLEGESVWLDGQRFSVAALGYPYPIDPGAHVIEVKRGDDLLLRREFNAGPGDNVSIKFDPHAASTNEAPSDNASTDDASQTSEQRGVNVGAGAGQGTE